MNNLPPPPVRSCVPPAGQAEAQWVSGLVKLNMASAEGNSLNMQLTPPHFRPIQYIQGHA